MQVLIIILLICWFGHLASSLINPDAEMLEHLGFSYLLGTGLFTFILFVLSLFGMKITGPSILVVAAGFIYFLKATLRRKRGNFRHKFLSLIRSFSNFPFGEKTLTIVIAGFILMSLLSTLYWPVNEWDALALYDFRAKVITRTGYFVQVASNYSYFAHYPLLTSLLHAIVYIFNGHNPQFVYSMQFLSFVMIFGASLRRFTTRRASLLATLLVVSTPILLKHSTISYTNLPYTIYFVLGMIYLFLSMEKQKKRYLILSGLMVGLSTWARDVEPFWLAGLIVLVVYAVWKRKYFYPFIYSVPFFAIQLPWRFLMVKFFGKARGVANQLSGAAVELVQKLDPDRIKEILSFVYSSVIISWGILFPIFITIAVVSFVQKSKAGRSTLLLIIAANFVILIVGTYLFSLNYPGWDHIPDSARRMAMFFSPLFIFYIGSTDIFARIANMMFFRKR